MDAHASHDAVIDFGGDGDRWTECRADHGLDPRDIDARADLQHHGADDGLARELVLEGEAVSVAVCESEDDMVVELEGEEDAVTVTLLGGAPAASARAKLRRSWSW